MKEHKSYFTRWLMDLNISDGTTKEEIMMKRLAIDPSAQVTKNGVHAGATQPYIHGLPH
jgi:hypothetical protein